MSKSNSQLAEHGYSVIEVTSLRHGVLFQPMYYGERFGAPCETLSGAWVQCEINHEQKTGV